MRAAPLPLLAQVVRTLRLTVLRIVAASTLSMSGFYVLFVWLPSHLRATAQIEWALELNVGVMTLWAVCVVSAGYVADSFRSAACCRRLPVHCIPAATGTATATSTGISSIALVCHHAAPSPSPSLIACSRPTPPPLMTGVDMRRPRRRTPLAAPLLHPCRRAVPCRRRAQRFGRARRFHRRLLAEHEHSGRLRRHKGPPQSPNTPAQPHGSPSPSPSPGPRQQSPHQRAQPHGRMRGGPSPELARRPPPRVCRRRACNLRGASPGVVRPQPKIDLPVI